MLVAHRCAMCELKTHSDSDLQIGYGALETRLDYACSHKKVVRPSVLCNFRIPCNLRKTVLGPNLAIQNLLKLCFVDHACDVAGIP